jgi:hypothetical protein
MVHNMQHMFCPKCGDWLVAVEDTLMCPTGDMPLSRAMLAGLTATFVDRTFQHAQPFTFLIGGEWFCPADGVQMTETAGIIQCGSCGGALNRFVHALIELHPHRKFAV